MILRPEARPSQSTWELPGCGKGQSGKGEGRLARPVWALAGLGVQTPGRPALVVCKVAQPTAHCYGGGAGGGEPEGGSLSTYCEALSTYCEPGPCPGPPVTLSHLTLIEQVPYSHFTNEESHGPNLPR